VPKFSSRFNFDRRVPKETILEDAPEGLRVAYLNSILEPLTYSNDLENDNNRPLQLFQLPKQYCGLARQEVPNFPQHTSHWDDLKSLVKEGEWFNFYDFVEHVGKRLMVLQDDFRSESWLSDYGFQSYKTKVNDLFAEAIGEGKSLEDTTTVYTVQNGQPQATVVKDPKQLATIREKLCANVKKSKLCPARIP
jgi:hypothetical protein